MAFFQSSPTARFCRCRPTPRIPAILASPISGVNIGGWHDADDFDLRVALSKTTCGNMYILATVRLCQTGSRETRTTGEQQYKDFLLSEADFIVEAINKVSWFIARAEQANGSLAPFPAQSDPDGMGPNRPLGSRCESAH